MIEQPLCEPDQPPSPDAMLDTALKRIRRKNSLQRLSKQWSGAMDVSRRVVEFATDRIPDANGDPLIHRCLRDALDASSRFTSNHTGRAMAPEMFTAFIVSILSPCADVLGHTVRCAHTNTAWNPFREPLHAFLSAHPEALATGSEEEVTHVQVLALFESLCERLISEQDLFPTNQSKDALIKEIICKYWSFYPALTA